MGSVYFKSDVEYRPGTYYTGGSEKRLDDESWGAVRALDVDDRRDGVGLQAAVATVGRGAVDRRRSGLRRLERRQLLRARREDRRAVVAVPGGRSHAREPDVVLSEGTATPRRRCGTRLRRLCLTGPVDSRQSVAQVPQRARTPSPSASTTSCPSIASPVTGGPWLQPALPLSPTELACSADITLKLRYLST